MCSNLLFSSRYGKQNTVVARSVCKLLKSVDTRSVRNATCIIRSFPKCCLRKISELAHFCNYLRRNCTGRSEHSSGYGLNIGAGGCVVPLVPFSMFIVSICKYPSTIQGIVLVEMAETHLEIA